MFLTEPSMQYVPPESILHDDTVEHILLQCSQYNIQRQVIHGVLISSTTEYYTNNIGYIVNG